jgi:hypothetical protein
LFLGTARALDPIGEWILAERDAFVSTEIFGTFARYALGQLKRLEQGARLADHRARVLEWLREAPDTSLDVLAARLAQATDIVAPTEADRVLRAKSYIKQLYRSLHDQGLIPASDYPALVELARGRGMDFELPRELRPKNAYNLVRLIETAAGWLETGAPTFEMAGATRDRLLAIKRGQVPLQEVLDEADARVPALEQARSRSRLPERPDIARADRLLRRIGQEVASRSVSSAPGPLGKDAPTPPEVTWND